MANIKEFENEYDRIQIDAGTLPQWARWVAVDENGLVFAFEREPKPSTFKSMNSWVQDIEDITTQIQYIGKVQIYNWKEAKWKL